MTTREAMNNLEEMRKFFTGCYMNAAKSSTAEKTFKDYVIAIDLAWMALNEQEDDGK